MLTENICSLDFRCIVAQCLMTNASKYSPLNISVILIVSLYILSAKSNASKYSPLNISVILVVSLYILSAKSIELAIHLYQWSSTWGTRTHLNVVCKQ
jgi:hypothetical protein